MTRPSPSLKLKLLLFPFVLPAVAINLFLLFLMLQSLGVPALSPVMALTIAIPLAFPANWAASRWVHALITEAERDLHD